MDATTYATLQREISIESLHPLQKARDERLYANVAAKGVELDLEYYLEEIAVQRRSHRDFPRLDPQYAPFDFRYRMTVPLLVKEVLEDAYTLIGIREVPSNIWNLERGMSGNIPAYCFFRPTYTEITGGRYIYIPITSRAAVAGKIPVIGFRDGSGTENLYPENLPLIRRSIEALTNYHILLCPDMPHPYYKDMLFTGRVSEVANGSNIYEYTDITGAFGIRDDVYTCNLRPTMLTMPLGLPSAPLVEDANLELTATPHKPSGGIMGDWVGVYEGWYTDPTYSYRPYYLYSDTTGKMFLNSNRPIPESE